MFRRFKPTIDISSVIKYLNVNLIGFVFDLFPCLCEIGILNNLCMVCPSILKAALPVGAITCNKWLEPISSKKSLIPFITSVLPVPPFPPKRRCNLTIEIRPPKIS